MAAWMQRISTNSNKCKTEGRRPRWNLEPKTDCTEDDHGPRDKGSEKAGSEDFDNDHPHPHTPKEQNQPTKEQHIPIAINGLLAKEMLMRLFLGGTSL